MVTIRSAKWPDDIDTVASLKPSFTTDHIYRPIRNDFAFDLVEEVANPSFQKQYDFDASDPKERAKWDCALIAEFEGQLAGFAAAQLETWNRRLIIWHLYVMSQYRRIGIATQLLDGLTMFAQASGARCLWLETQNVNYPAIQFYRRSGFHLCGFDESLYECDSAIGTEVALFFMRSVSNPSN